MLIYTCLVLSGCCLVAPLEPIPWANCPPEGLVGCIELCNGQFYILLSRFSTKKLPKNQPKNTTMGWKRMISMFRIFVLFSGDNVALSFRVSSCKWIVLFGDDFVWLILVHTFVLGWHINTLQEVHVVEDQVIALKLAEAVFCSLPC